MIESMTRLPETSIAARMDVDAAVRAYQADAGLIAVTRMRVRAHRISGTEKTREKKGEKQGVEISGEIEQTSTTIPISMTIGQSLTIIEFVIISRITSTCRSYSIHR